MVQIEQVSFRCDCILPNNCLSKLPSILPTIDRVVRLGQLSRFFRRFSRTESRATRGRPIAKTFARVRRIVGRGEIVRGAFAFR